MEDPNEFSALVRGGGCRHLKMVVQNGTKCLEKDGITSIPQVAIKTFLRILVTLAPLTLMFEIRKRGGGTKLGIEVQTGTKSWYRFERRSQK